VQKWRRGYVDRPPPWTDELLRVTVDRRYEAAAAAAVVAGDEFPPRAESLRDCVTRLEPFIEGELEPAIRAAVDRAQSEADRSGREYDVPAVLVVASENVLRGLVMSLERLGADEVPLIDVPYAVPLVYQLESVDGRYVPIETPWAEAPLRSGWYLGSPEKVRAVQLEIQNDLPPAEQDEEVCLVPMDGTDPSSLARWKC